MVILSAPTVVQLDGWTQGDWVVLCILVGLTLGAVFFAMIFGGRS